MILAAELKRINSEALYLQTQRVRETGINAKFVR